MTGVQTAISAVTVYPDRARVTRRGEVTLEPGVHRIEVLPLPLTLDTSSVRASARGTARARLLGVDVRRSFYLETPDEVVRRLERDIEALQDKMSALSAQAEALKGERAALQGLQGSTQEFARGLAFARTTPADQAALYAMVHERTAALDAQLQQLAVAQRSDGRKLQKLNEELAQLGSARRRERFSAEVEVEVVQAGSLTLDVTYVVSRAGWRPLYDVRLAGDGGTLEVGYLAQVTQSTGEAWEDVALTLSTARPALAGTLPKLDPWYVGPARPAMPPMPAPEMAKATPQAGMQRMRAALSAPAEPLAYEAEVVQAVVESSGAAVTYLLPAAANVPPDGAPHKVTVAHYPLAPKLDYVSAPKLVEAAYRRAKVANDSAYTLLAGPANLFAGDEFIGTTQLELTAPGGGIELFLGVDDRLRVKRELKRRDVDKKMLSDRRRLVYGYEIKVTNLLDQQVALTLHDQVPVSQDEQVKVRLEWADPKPALQSDLGLLEWQLTLAPREERAIRFEFSVEHPRDMNVTGLG